MPQIIPPINGFKFVIYFDDHEPTHVHVKKDEFEVKIDIEGNEAVLMKGEEIRRVASNKKYVKQALALVNANLEVIKQRWEELEP
ncbi:MAG: DUF4160 domain-containing protein [Phormidesmis sp.]